MEIWERFLEITAKEQPLFRDFITLPLLDGQANWTEAEQPLAYTRASIENQKRDQASQLRKQHERERPLQEYQEPEFSGEAVITAEQFRAFRARVLKRVEGELRTERSIFAA
jgi:hypothetical protein